ncbi:hypothetical protein RHGRI_018798 [Rhododendron griersonianum]|uniref:RNase H type-1 domain-containing protein n=1 Tax=Rhododendron griersonianum TaxID=479676 RepID=A0AAV6K2R6_9ERIC|nr:hypothetical protein RHGRI_018798 [Rhododendron griersonianum]
MSFCWEKPVANHLKANQDGSHKEYPDGSEYVIRDTLGEIVSLGVVPLSFALSSLEVEMAGFYLAVVECQRIRASNVIFEGDSKQVLRDHYLAFGNTECPVLVKDIVPVSIFLGRYYGLAFVFLHIFWTLATFEDYKIVHQYREANVVADELVDMATQVYRDPEVHDFDELLQKAYNHEFDDCLDTPRYHITQSKKKLQELIQ